MGDRSSTILKELQDMLWNERKFRWMYKTGKISTLSRAAAAQLSTVSTYSEKALAAKFALRGSVTLLGQAC